MLGRLFLLFILVPFVELALLFWLADLTDWKLTFGLVVITGIVGAVLAKSQGIRAWHNVQTQLSTGKPPADALLDAAMILVAGALLLTPGLLTDLFGFSLLVPLGRKFYRGRLRAFFRKHVHFETMHGARARQRQSEIIDVEIVPSGTDQDHKSR